MDLTDYAKHLDTAKKLAYEKHAGQTDLTGAPYIDHVKTVASIINISIGNSWCETVAWLHDLIEDTDVTIDTLYVMGFPERIIHAVDQLTRKDGDSYGDYINGIYSPLARRVKMADLIHNMDTNRFGVGITGTKKDHARVAKYRKALKQLAQNETEIRIIYEHYKTVQKQQAQTIEQP